MKFKKKVLNSKGYVIIYNPTHHLANCKGYVFEHRLVMEKSLGRLLKSEERIHHINRNKQDNKIKNLLLFPTESKHQSSISHKYKEFIYKDRAKEYMRKYMRERMRKIRGSIPRYEHKGGYYEQRQISCRG